MAELESWIKEKEHIFSSLDYGKDLTSVLALQSKHSAFEDELGARRAHLQEIMKEGDKIIQAGHFDTPQVDFFSHVDCIYFVCNCLYHVFIHDMSLNVCTWTQIQCAHGNNKVIILFMLS